jgi:periplasmic protein CpxP/Spy
MGVRARLFKEFVMVEATKVNAAGTARARGIKRVALGLLVAVAGTVAVSAWAQGHGPGRGGEFGGPGMFMGRPEQAGRMVDHLLDGLNATDAQRAQVKQIVQAAAADLKAQHEAAQGLHEKGMGLFTAPTVDARAVEALRQQMLAQHDQASKRVTQALLDIANVLTPEQRTKLGERMKQRSQHMHERMQQRAGASAPTR